VPAASLLRSSSEDQYQLLFEGNPNPMWVYDVETLRFLAVNEAAVRVYGYSREEFLAKTIVEIRPAEERPRLLALLEELPPDWHTALGSPGSWRHLCKDGTELDVEISSQPLSFDGRPARVVQVLDVTARLRAEQALRESEARYRGLIENANDLIATIDLDRRFTTVNAAFERVLGYDRGELVGRPITDVVPEDSQQALRQAYEEKVDGTAAAATYEHELLAKDGTRITVEVASRVIEVDGRPAGIQAICRDLTERKRAAEALRATQERFQLVVEHSRDMIALFEADGRIIYTSPSHETTLGFRPDELEGHTFAEFVHPDDLEAVGSVLEDAVSGVPRESVARVRRSDGTYVTVEGIASPILDESGELRMLVSSSRDISERLRAAELEERLHQSRRLESVGRLAGGIAHDFNNLLTAMNGYGEIALARLAEPGADEKLGECFEEIRHAGDKATMLVSQLLALSRRQVLQPTVLDLNHVVQDYEPMLGRLLGDDIHVRVALADDLGAVLADEGQLGQVIVNLAVNARDAMPAGGTLSMSTRNVTLEDTVGPLPPGEYVMLAVEDTGLGIEPELLDQVFDPFFTTKGPGEGSGLGLATVLGVVEQSGGYVSVYSEPGVGTTFKVYLPRTELTPVPVPHEADHRTAGCGERLLLVEDNDAVRRLAYEVLELSGYEVRQAASPREALELCASDDQEIDLLVTDVVMPELNGRELADRLRAERPGLRVLYTSGYTDDAMISRGVLAPGMAFLQKPFSVEQLQRKLREVLADPGESSRFRPE
jgi:PAS domain S-box-containing protein